MTKAPPDLAMMNTADFHPCFSSPSKGGTSLTVAITRPNFFQFPRLARMATVSRRRQADTW
jgi:hypothetical protein